MALLQEICEKLVHKYFAASMFKAVKVCFAPAYGMKCNVLHVFAEPLVEDLGWKGSTDTDVSSLSKVDYERYTNQSLFDPSQNEVFQFSLQVDSYVNGRLIPVSEYLHYTPTDELKVTYKWLYNRRSSEDPQLIDDYLKILRHTLFINGR